MSGDATPQCTADLSNTFRGSDPFRCVRPEGHDGAHRADGPKGSAQWTTSDAGNHVQWMRTK